MHGTAVCMWVWGKDHDGNDIVISPTPIYPRPGLYVWNNTATNWTNGEVSLMDHLNPSSSSSLLSVEQYISPDIQVVSSSSPTSHVSLHTHTHTHTHMRNFPPPPRRCCCRVEAGADVRAVTLDEWRWLRRLGFWWWSHHYKGSVLRNPSTLLTKPGNSRSSLKCLWILCYYPIRRPNQQASDFQVKLEG